MSAARLVCVALGLTLAAGPAWAASPQRAPGSTADAKIHALEQRVAELEKRTQPELGNQMLLLELRHDRLWWAGEAGNWNLAYYMAGEMGEAIRDIVGTNGDAAELQPR
jgi:hypothetical protein